MTKRSVENDLDDMSEEVLGGLDPGKRLRMSLEALADGDLDKHERLMETTPIKSYKLTDPEYTDAVEKVVLLSTTAMYQLRLQYRTLMNFEAERDKQVLAMLLNEALGRLGRDDFGVDGFGNVTAGDHDEADYDYGKTQAPGTARLATKYRRLWDDLPFKLIVDESDRNINYFPELAAGGLLGYPDDLDMFDDIEDDRIASEAYRSELRLAMAVVSFYTHFHGWRLFAGEHLGVTLDEFLDVTMEDAVEDDGVVAAMEIDEKTCENVLSLREDYLEAYPGLVRSALEDEEEGDLEIDLDERAQKRAQTLGEVVELPIEQAAD